MRGFASRLLALLIGILLPLTAALAQQQDLQLPAPDITAPKLVYDPAAEPATAGQPFVISVTATDETGVESVSLFYRRTGEGAFTRLEMDAIGGDMYMVMVPAEDMREPGIEYYVQAADQAGNTVLRGYSFQPLAVEVVPGPTVEVEPEPIPQPAAPEPEPTVAKADSGAPTWIWVLLGVGAAAALAGGGGGGAGGGGAGGGGGGEVTVPIDAPIPQ